MDQIWAIYSAGGKGVAMMAIVTNGGNWIFVLSLSAGSRSKSRIGSRSEKRDSPPP